MEAITLETKEQLDIYMNPQRQRLLRILEQSRTAKTAKELSGDLGISASSVQHHLRKLESLGLVFVDHTAVIRGITARYYKTAPVTVHIGTERDDGLYNERSLIVKSMVAAVLDDTLSGTRGKADSGDVLVGTIHLKEEERAALQALIQEFLLAHSVPKADTRPWEYAMIYHPTEGQP